MQLVAEELQEENSVIEHVCHERLDLMAAISN
jgi:hypothetical protein